jgi:predicted cupin superfamily sugar epimerase
MAPYPYPTPNSELIKRLNMVPHPEGGYFVETMRNADWKVSSEYAGALLPFT